ncbi:MAG: thioredoxin-disulfide reductase [Clostridiales bacterium]|nr:thioredoxin-disulfide reductase [Clostridiales bacterium]
MMDIIVIGGGPAGMTAAIYAARAGLSCTVLESGVAGGQLATTSTVENYPGFPNGVGGVELSTAMEQQAKNLGANIKYAEVTDVDLAGEVKTITLKNGETLHGKAVIIACGAAPRKLGISGEEELRGMGVSYCATCDGFFFKNLEVCVIGGGDTAAEDALFLARTSKKVHLIHRRGELRAAKSLQNRIFAAENIETHLGYVPLSIDGKFEVDSLKVQNVETGEEESIPCQGVFVAVGHNPNTALFTGKVGLDDAGYIVTGEDLATDVPGVFAAGDIRQKDLRQVITAAADGAVATISCERYLLD